MAGKMAAELTQILVIVASLILLSNGRMFTKPSGCPDDYVIHEPDEFLEEQLVDSETQCLTSCDNNAQCASYNYEAVEDDNEGICELTTEAADKWGLQLDTEPGFGHYVKTDMAEEDVEACSEYPGPQQEIYAVGTREQVHQRGDQSSFWMYDMYDTDPERLYWADGYNNINWIDEFQSETTFKANSRVARHTLSEYYWEGVNNVVIDRHFWYRAYNQRFFLVMDLETDTIVGRFNDLAYHEENRNYWDGSCGYNGGRESSTDLAVDESGLWVIWGTISPSCRLAVSKVDHKKMTVTRTWYVDQTKTSHGNAFIAQGILYVIDGYNTKPAWIKYAYNLRNNSLTAWDSLYTASIFIANTYQYMHYADYNPRDKMLYTVENTRMGRYPLLFRDRPTPNK